MKIEEIVEKIEIATGKRAVRMSGGSYRLHCPVHNDENASFILTYGTKKMRNGNTSIVGHCFGCNCSVQTWTAAIGITVRELFEN